MPLSYPILHLTYDPAVPALAFFAQDNHRVEDNNVTLGLRDYTFAPKSHPYTLDHLSLINLLTSFFGEEASELTRSSWYIPLPTINGEPINTNIQDETDTSLVQTDLTYFAVPVILCPFENFLRSIKTLSKDMLFTIGDTFRFWVSLTEYSVFLVRKGDIIPGFLHENPVSSLSPWAPNGEPSGVSKEMKYYPVWNLALSPSERGRLIQYTSAMPPICRYVTSYHPEYHMPDPIDRTIQFITSMIRTICKAAVHQNQMKIRTGRRMINEQRDQLAFYSVLAGRDLPSSFGVKDYEYEYEYEYSKAFIDNITKWLSYQKKYQSNHEFIPCIRLEDPPENEREPWILSLHLRSVTDPSLLIPAEMIWNKETQQYAILPPITYLEESLLSGLARAAALSPLIYQHFKGFQPSSSVCSLDEASHFLSSDARILQENGFNLIFPPWWTDRQLRPKVKLTAKRQGSVGPETHRLGISALVEFDYMIAVGDETFSPDDFFQEVDLKVPFIQVKGRWVRYDPESFQKGMKIFKRKYATGRATTGDLLRLAATDELIQGVKIDVEPKDAWTADLLKLVQEGSPPVPQTIPNSFMGKLRPYQEKGVSFLHTVISLGFGACLADDMGLGKTPQTIAWLLGMREENPGLPPALVVCPMSIVGNWEREIRRFAPSLTVLIHHGSGRSRGEELIQAAGAYDIVITTYHLVNRDEDHLSALSWSAIILDEAQKVKNWNTKQAKSVRALSSQARVTLTGTPIENHLSELWAIMEFLNPGYLGSYHGFRERYAIPIERVRDQKLSNELRHLISPFILRRMKTDPSVIQDLPEKMEYKVYCTLTRHQAALYQAVVDEMVRDLDLVTGIARKGAVLRVLTRLKQICNHPGLITGGTVEHPNRSGKVMRLIEMLEEIGEEGESALVFTQYAKFAEELAVICSDRLSFPVLMLTGSTPRAKREELIAKFQTQPRPQVFIISLRAGGIGLNLTAATHVFHIDRWWNPAVEDQATDRTYRIGQTERVQVHLLIAIGTLEERIDQMLNEKRELANSVIGGNEEWLTSLSTPQLLEVVTLRDAILAEEE